MAEPGEPLTERELEILQYLATGASNKEIAYQLNISINTVKVHLRNIFAKLGAASRTEATMIAIREGWVAVPEARRMEEAESPAIAAPLASEALQAGVVPAPEPPLPWYRRIALMGALLLAVGAAVLTWVQSPAPASEATGPLPIRSGAVQAQVFLPEGTSRWVERAQMPTRRVWLATAVVDRRLFAIGGETPEGVTGIVEVYSPEADTWTRGTPRPVPAAYIQAGAIDRRIFVPGGCTEPSVALSQVDAYSPETDSWTSVAPLPYPRCGYALAVHEGRLYLFGGTDGHTYAATTLVYDPKSDRWEERAPMPEALTLSAAQVLDGRIYVVGGYREGQEQRACWVYDPEKNAWDVCVPMTLGRGGLGLAVVAGQIYAIGGGGWGSYLGFNERYASSQGAWTAVETPLVGEWYGAGVSVVDMTIYAVGGYSKDYLSLTLAFEPLPFRIFIPATQR
ncbi:MAG: LuxR C-terminal-related transcriptional regulator [Anaerolineae bacterium]|nr:LuxR C-terminal-related transcriptional regulator [Anaerolineae bacterium]MCX8066247.1 LuxR C-terminal-related transcriptional regulator [Anaerolineae bacterium]